MFVALDDRFVVAIPTTMKVIGFFQANTNALILPELRSDVARRLGNVTTGWSAVAAGAGGGPGLALGFLASRRPSTVLWPIAALEIAIVE